MSYPSAEKQAVYSTAPADWASERERERERAKKRNDFLPVTGKFHFWEILISYEAIPTANHANFIFSIVIHFSYQQILCKTFVTIVWSILNLDSLIFRPTLPSEHRALYGRFRILVLWLLGSP